MDDLEREYVWSMSSEAAEQELDDVELFQNYGPGHDLDVVREEDEDDTDPETDFNDDELGDDDDQLLRSSPPPIPHRARPADAAGPAEAAGPADAAGQLADRESEPKRRKYNRLTASAKANLVCILELSLTNALEANYEELARSFNISLRTVYHYVRLVKSGGVKLDEKRTRKQKLSAEQIEELANFVVSNRESRRLTLKTVAKRFGISASTCRRYLATKGIKKHVAVAKPPLEPKHRAARLAWAQEHVGWTKEQWYQVLWSDETWMTYGSNCRVFVFRRANERLHDDCVRARYQRPQGWMFFGSFHGMTKGPGFLWQRKEWGTIKAASYTEHTMPKIAGYLAQHPGMIFMQDNAPPHTGKTTKKWMAENGIAPMVWPARSPDLNPIENVWAMMKRYLNSRYGDGVASTEVLSARIVEAWESIRAEDLERLVGTMAERCHAVIAAQGGFINW